MEARVAAGSSGVIIDVGLNYTQQDSVADEECF
jgi:hypothetical protein